MPPITASGVHIASVLRGLVHQLSNEVWTVNHWQDARFREQFHVAELVLMAVNAEIYGLSERQIQIAAGCGSNVTERQSDV